jgi:hypothetical protein
VRADTQLLVDLDQLTGVEQPPARIAVHALARQHYEWTIGALRGVHAGAEAALVQERLTGAPLEYVKRVRLRVAQRPQAVPVGEHAVDREQRQAGGHPSAGGRDPSLDVTAVRRDLARDQREESLGVGVAFDQAHLIAEVRLQRRQILEHAVVCEQAPVLLEGVCVAPLQRARRGEADVRHERPRGDLARLAREPAVLVGGVRLLAHVRAPLLVEPAEAGPIRLPVALDGQAVGRVEQPEPRRHGLTPCAHAEQATHDAPRKLPEIARPAYAGPVPTACPEKLSR